MARCLVTVLEVAFLLLLAKGNSETTLHILTVLPYRSDNPNLVPSWDSGADLLPAAQLAVSLLNQRPDILPGYRLDLVNADGGCSEIGIAAQSFLEWVAPKRTEDNRIVGVVGPACSSSSMEFSRLTGREEYSLVNVHLGASLLLASRESFPNAFSIVGPSESITMALFALLDVAQWRTVAALVETERPYFNTVFREFIAEVKKRNEDDNSTTYNVTISSPVFETHIPLTEIKQNRTRVIIVFTGTKFAQEVACLAYSFDMFYPRFQWIFVSREFSEFNRTIKFQYDQFSYDCTAEMQYKAVTKSLFLNYKLTPQEKTTRSDSGYTYEEFRDMYQAKIDELNKQGRHLTRNVWGSALYDAVWSMALALNASQHYNMTDLTLYSRGNLTATKQIRSQLENLDFDGVSGRVRYNSTTGFNSRAINIFQEKSGMVWSVGLYYEKNGSSSFHTIISDVISDSFPFKNQPPPRQVGFVAFYIIAGIEFVAIVCVHVTTWIYRKSPSVRASSIRLNQLVFLGCYILLVDIVLFVTAVSFELSDKANNVLCQLTWPWLWSIGYVLIYGTTLVKTWRLYRIFAHYMHPGIFLSDIALAVYTLLLLFVNVVICILWSAIDPRNTSSPRGREIIEFVHEGDEVFLLRVVPTCRSEYELYWSFGSEGYKIVIFIGILCLSLLMLNARVISKNFATKNLLWLSLTSTIFFGITFPLFYFFRESYHQPVIEYILGCLILIGIVFLSLLFLLLPPVIPILKEKVRTLKADHRSDNLPLHLA